MKTLQCTLSFLFLTLMATSLSFAQGQDVIYVKMANEKRAEKSELKTYLIEREIPDAGMLSAEQLKGISQKSCSVLKEMGPQIQWIHSYVTDDKVYCIYKAENEALIREHANKGGFPVNYVTELATVIDPETSR
jgi:trimethylamine:corrinoid methyltransferase-like protein